MSKIIYSEKHQNYLAIKLRDISKHEGRDHVILEVGDRELMADFMMAHAEVEEDDIVFEQNEEFSMLVNSAPVWFNFDDVDRCKREAARLFKSGNDTLTGFMEVKTSSALNYFKALFQGGRSGWENKYFVLKGMKLYIYEGRSYTKPEKVLTFAEDMSFHEVRKADASGKEFVISVTAEQGQEPLLIAASSTDSFIKWTRAFASLKQRYVETKIAAKELELRDAIGREDDENLFGLS